MSETSERIRIAAIQRLRGVLRERGEVDVSTLIHVRVRSRRMVPDEHTAAIRAELLEEAAAHGGAKVTVEFKTDDALAVDYEITCWRDDPVGPTEPDPEPEADQRGRSCLLVLSRDRLSCDYLLRPRDSWLGLARAPEERTDIAIPPWMSAIPRGRFLELRYLDEVLTARRTDHRPEYTVLIDDEPLTVGRERVFPTAGVLGFRAEDGVVERLRYDLLRWSPGDVPDAGPADPGDGEPHQVWLTISGRSGSVLIDAPRRGVLARRKAFPVRGTDRGAPFDAMYAQVLVTTGSGGPTGDGRWHVKLYRCLTPEHARFLRRYLMVQADLVHKVNIGIGGRVDEPPWAIAPVHVLPADASRPRDEAPETGTWLTEEEIVNQPEYRLPAWFGQADQPQPGCYVIVLTPRLSKVNWAGSDLLGPVPAIGQLRDLRNLAIAVDTCHTERVAHCDITPANVCRSSVGTDFVLVDGDSVCRTDESVFSDIRFTAPYASPAMIEAARRWRAPTRRDTGKVNLVEHDRFGFVLVVMVAILGRDRVDQLVELDERESRVIDDADRTARVISQWARLWGEQWQAVAGHLTGALRPNALAGDGWSALDWLDRLQNLGEEAERRDSRPGPAPAPEEPESTSGRFQHRVDRIRRAVAEAEVNSSKELRRLVVRNLRGQINEVARDRYWRYVMGAGVLPIAAATLFLISVVVNK